MQTKNVQINRNSKIIFWSGIIGNSLDHYDSALYAFLAPFLAPLFFPNSDPIVALILVYGIKSFGLFTRPLGSVYFGHLARRKCIKKLLATTLSGVAICTVLIGLIPDYATLGILSPLLLAVTRGAQGFFASGEHNIASLFVLDQVADVKKHSKVSSYYLFSTMMGTLLASLAAWLVSISPNPSFYWRTAFLLGFFTGAIGLFLRFKIQNISEEQNTSKKIKQKIKDQTDSSFKILTKNRWKVAKIIPISSFTFVTYSIPFIFLNNVAPHVTDVKIEALLMYSTALVTINNLLIPIFAQIVGKFDVIKWMASLSLVFAITIVPIFAMIPHMGLHGITIAKIWIIVIGVAFVAPLNAFLYKLSPGKEKYLVSGFGYAIGIELLGRNTTTICLALWYWTGELYLPAIYVATIAATASFCLISEIRSTNSHKKGRS